MPCAFHFIIGNTIQHNRVLKLPHPCGVTGVAWKNNSYSSSNLMLIALNQPELADPHHCLTPLSAIHSLCIFKNIPTFGPPPPSQGLLSTPLYPMGFSFTITVSIQNRQITLYSISHSPPSVTCTCTVPYSFNSIIM